MHLGNGIICPMTALPMAAFAFGSAIYAYKKAKSDFTKDKIILTIVLSAFVFALQMINFSIPYTNSSGHIIGTILLAMILGPSVAFLSMCAILLVQSLFFADGGLLTLGCNIFNMGFIPCFIIYPLVFKPLKQINKPLLAIIISSILALQSASIAAAFETTLSSTTGSFLNFAAFMQLIHLPIGIIEGLLSAGIYLIYQKISSKNFCVSISAASIILAGLISSFASKNPDGLEWSLLKISDSVTLQTQNILYKICELVQTKIAILSNAPQIFANLGGILILAVLMYALCMLLDYKKIKN